MLLKKDWDTNNKKLFRKLLTFFRTNTIKGNEDGILLVQMVKDYEYTIKLAAASKFLADKYNLIVKLHDVNIYWSNKYKLVSKFHSNTNKKINLSYSNSVAFENSRKFHNKNFIKAELKKIIFSLYNQNPRILLSLKFEDILVGDLIYDTYLRFYNKPTIENIDKDVIKVIEFALNIYYNFKCFINSNNLKILVNTYTSYIHHGITVRICLQNNIDVYTVAPIFQKIEINYPFHQINHTLFDPEFQLTKEQFELAKGKLESRFKGNIDSATIYMKVSAFSNSLMNPIVQEQFRIKTRNIVIYMHDFYDAPHMNRLLQFPDLYQFLKQTLAGLINLKDTSVFVKLHPNVTEVCSKEAISLINSFNSPHFFILDKSTSNLNIIELKPNLICTARGTVGIEMAYFNIPTVALYDNLYANFNFVHTCYNLIEYFSILRGELKTEIDFNKDKIISFYYQAYIKKIPQELNNIFDILASYAIVYDTYSDKYLNKIFELQDVIFSEKFVKSYKN